MIRYHSRLLRREVVAEQTILCHVERPEGMEFEAGQYVEVGVVDPPFTDAQGGSRSMSIASAPHEPELAVLMRVRDSAYKRSMAAIPIGAPLFLEGPADDLGLRRVDGRHLVLVAGGVGVAPFMSLLREVEHGGGELQATLFYSNRRPEDAPWLGELEALLRGIPGFRYFPTMTRMPESTLPWAGETGRLGVSLFERHLPALVGPRYFISGSTLLVSALCQELEHAAVPPRDIRIEMYAGY